MAINMMKIPTGKQGLNLRVAQGHFATSHSHMNYFIDITMQKTRLSEAQAVAKELADSFRSNTIVPRQCDRNRLEHVLSQRWSRNGDTRQRCQGNRRLGVQELLCTDHRQVPWQ